MTTLLTATRSAEPQPDGLAPTADLSTKALEVPDPGAVESRWEDGSWVVTVGVTVTNTIPATDQISEPVTVARRQYFHVLVAIDAIGAGECVDASRGGGWPDADPKTRPR